MLRVLVFFSEADKTLRILSNGMTLSFLLFKDDSCLEWRTLEAGWSTYGLEGAQEEMGGGWSCAMVVRGGELSELSSA